MQPDLRWQKCGEFADIVYEKAEGIARVTINRPHRRNAFTPDTVAELLKAFGDARDDATIGVVLLRGANPQHDGKFAFCAGGDQKIRGDKKGGYMGKDGVPRLNVLDLQRLIRSMPKVVIALVAGFAIGGGHVLHVICDLTIAADNAIFGQVGPKMGSFDGGFGSSYLARMVGQKKAREIWFLCRQYNAQEALAMGLVNKIFPADQLAASTYAYVRDLVDNVSPRSMAVIKRQQYDAPFQTLAENTRQANVEMARSFASDDFREGVAHFMEKRTPQFKGV